MTGIELAAFDIAWSGASAVALISNAICGSLIAAALLVATSGTRRFGGMGFAALFVYLLWRYTIPAYLFFGVIYLLLWHRLPT